MIELKKVDGRHQDFKYLVSFLDESLKETDGDEHDFYHQFNGITEIKYAFVAYENTIPVGCGAIKHFDKSTVEVKRMYVKDNCRGKGIASIILLALEDWAKTLGYTFTILETGKRQQEALRLYKKNGYVIIENYGQYKDVENSVCFKKQL
ncbi:GNAT family N-acetyltransferase [Zhouia sp. PK063]|uniref:GNAT family N-acetyltransferase n=1 Tax=Zhouia sp. PK063 TaxID=3373602 RepID=UPI0037A8009A